MNTSESSSVVFTAKHNDGIAVVTINRPGQLNALNLQVKRLLEETFLQLIDDDEVSVIILTGAEQVFVAGTDISEMVDMTATDHTKFRTGEVFNVLRNCPKPIIAAVERFALGGGFELALACDIIVAGEKTKFGQPEIKVGIMPGAGGTQYLLRTIGKYQTMRMVLTGEHITAQQALERGLVSEVVETGKALETAQELAKTITTMPPLAVRSIKEVVKQGADMSLTNAFVFERKAFQTLFDSVDQVEGMKAFLEKRSPQFIGE